MWLDRQVRQLHQAISSATARLKLPQIVPKSVTQLARRFRRGEGAQVVTPDRFAEAIRREADQHYSLQRIEVPDLVARCDAAMKRFTEVDQTKFDTEALDAWSRQVWASMPLKTKFWKGAQPVATITAPLLAAVLIPIDGGGTAVLVFASTKELLVAAGIAAAMTPMAAGGQTESIIQRETPWRQLSDLFAVTCDALVVPRPTDSELSRLCVANESRRLLTSEVDVQLPEGTTPTMKEWELDQELLAGIESHLQRVV